MCIVLTKEVIKKICSNAEGAMNFLERHRDMHLGEVIGNKELFCAFLYCFVMFAQAVLTMANYIIVKRNFDLPKNFQESLMILVDSDIIPENLEPQAKLLVELRNLILHNETEVSSENIQTIAENLSQFKEIYIAIKGEIGKILGEK